MCIQVLGVSKCMWGSYGVQKAVKPPYYFRKTAKLPLNSGKTVIGIS